MAAAGVGAVHETGVHGGAASAAQPAGFDKAAQAARNAGSPTAHPGAAPGQVPPADAGLPARLDKMGRWAADAHKIHDSIADTINHPAGGHFGNSDADMGDARVSLNRMQIHLGKLDGLQGQARSPEFQHLQPAEQHRILQSMEAEAGHVRDFATEAGGKAGAANREVANNDEHRAQIGMTTTKVVMAAAPVVIGAIVEKETGSKLAGTAARDASMVGERYLASWQNQIIGGSESTLDGEIGTKRQVLIAAGADFATAGALNKLKPAEGMATHAANATGGFVKGGASAAADEDPIQHPGAFATKFALGGAAGALSEGAKIPGGLDKIKGTGREHVVNTTMAAGAGAMGAAIQGKNPLEGAAAGVTKVAGKGVGEKLHAQVPVLDGKP